MNKINQFYIFFLSFHTWVSKWPLGLSYSHRVEGKLDVLGCKSRSLLYKFIICIRDHSFKTSANFHDFWPLPPSVGSFLVLSVGKFGKFLTPPPPKTCRRLKWMVPKFTIQSSNPHPSWMKFTTCNWYCNLITIDGVAL